MTDTQWPRFAVFQQAAEGEPHQHVGSVHAPDAEMALLNARDVFVRRPQCLSLWVVPAEKIFAKTAQELVEKACLEETVGQVQAEREPYYVFQKLEQRGTHSYVGVVKAQTPAQALRLALDTFTEHTALVWWVFPARLVTQSSAEDKESWFDPAVDKLYKQPTSYRTSSQMHQIKSTKT
jgi:ring-1,2-phenylacetyl-CoA epoxidase subunit PaaB